MSGAMPFTSAIQIGFECEVSFEPHLYPWTEWTATWISSWRRTSKAYATPRTRGLIPQGLRDSVPPRIDGWSVITGTLPPPLVKVEAGHAECGVIAH